MLYLFREHHLTPGEYHRMPEGEQILLQAFYLWDMERRRV